MKFTLIYPKWRNLRGQKARSRNKIFLTQNAALTL